jgi:hypothetical protein
MILGMILHGAAKGKIGFHRGRHKLIAAKNTVHIYACWNFFVVSIFSTFATIFYRTALKERGAGSQPSRFCWSDPTRASVGLAPVANGKYQAWSHFDL